MPSFIKIGSGVSNQSNQIKFICDKKEHNATQKNKANMFGLAP